MTTPWNGRPGQSSRKNEARSSAQSGTGKYRDQTRDWGVEHSVVHSARALVINRDYTGAIDMMNPYLRSEPGDVEARLVRGWAMLAEGDADGAIGDLETARGVDPAHRDVLFYLALAYSQADRGSEAVTVAQDRLRRYPDDPRSTTLLAQVSAPEPEFGEALDTSQGAVALSVAWQFLTRAALGLWIVLFAVARVRLLFDGPVASWGKALGLIGVVLTLAIWGWELYSFGVGGFRAIRIALRGPWFALAFLTHGAALLTLALTAGSDTRSYPTLIGVAISASVLSGLLILARFVSQNKRS